MFIARFSSTGFSASCLLLIAISNCGGKTDTMDDSYQQFPHGTTSVNGRGGSSGIAPTSTKVPPTGGNTGTFSTTGKGGGSAAATTILLIGKGGNAPMTTITPPRHPPSSHRETASSCVNVHSPGEPFLRASTQPGTCTKHADCTNGTNGRCANTGALGYGYPTCVYDTCGSDNDCDPGKVCYCSTTDAARCLAVGNCTTDADCSNTGLSYCSLSYGYDFCGWRFVEGYFCHTGNDECVDDSDCISSETCNYDAYVGRWKCMERPSICAIG